MNVQGSLDVWKDLVDLRVLNLENNALAGTISFQLDVRHPVLEILNVRFNALTGTLPSAFANFPSLQLLSLESNQLNGTIPSSLGLSSSLGTYLLLMRVLEKKQRRLHANKFLHAWYYLFVTDRSVKTIRESIARASPFEFVP